MQLVLIDEKQVYYESKSSRKALERYYGLDYHPNNNAQ